MIPFAFLVAGFLVLATENDAQEHAVNLAPYQPRAIAVNKESTTIDLTATDDKAAYLLIVGSLSREDRCAVAVNCCQIEKPSKLPPAPSRNRADWLARITAQKCEMELRRRSRADEQKRHVVAKFPQQRSFHLFVREDDFLDRSSYQEVNAELVHVSEDCLVYVDTQDRANGFPDDVAFEVAEVFDRHVLPNARKLYGNHLDVDRNGKFTILFTHWLDNLSNGKVSIGGFVRGSDFLADLAPPYSNQCDMMYLNSNLRPGEHLRTLIAHEYTHAVTFSEHTFGEYLPGNLGEDEETWLSEAMAHLAENFIGSGWSNLDYRISAYLNAPHRYQLVVPDYYRAGLWRCHGSRGATYLFLRWCVDKFGAEILEELSRSNLQGTENLETATLTPFEELFREWSVATCLSGISAAADETSSFASINLRDRLETRVLAGPRFHDLSVGDSAATSLEPTSWYPFLFQVPRKTAVRLKLTTAATDHIQVTLLRLPHAYPEVEIMANDSTNASQRLLLRHYDGPPVHWTKMTIEPESLPQTKTSNETPEVAILDLEQTVKNPRTEPGDDLLCPPVPFELFGNECRVAKLLGIDDQGNKVTVWTTLPQWSDALRTAELPSHGNHSR